MPLSPLENPATYRDREMVRRLMPIYEKQICTEAWTGVSQGAALTREAMEWHAGRAQAFEDRMSQRISYGY